MTVPAPCGVLVAVLVQDLDGHRLGVTHRAVGKLLRTNCCSLYGRSGSMRMGSFAEQILRTALVLDISRRQR